MTKIHFHCKSPAERLFMGFPDLGVPPLLFSNLSKKLSVWLSSCSISHRAHFHFVLLALAFSALSSADASTVVLQGGFGYPVTNSADGAAIDPGFEVSVGTFADGFDPAAAPSDLPALLAAWTEYAKTATATIDGVPGSFYLKHINNTPAFAGKKIYIFLTRTSNHASPAADAANVTDYGVFSSSQAAWVFPAVDEDLQPPLDLTQLNTAQIDSALWGAVDPSALALAFKADTNTSPSAWDSWVAALLGSNPDPALASALADPTATLPGASVNNLLSFALDSNPLVSGPPPYQVITIPAENGTPATTGITYTRKKASVSGFTTLAEASSDLSTWDLPVTETITSSTDTTEDVRVTPATPTNKAFFRIKVAPVGQD
jgi:hypothetical protein